MWRSIFLIFLSLCLSSKVIGQVSSGSVIYKTHKLTDTLTFGGNKMAKSLSNQIGEISKNFSFRLLFNDHESLFQLIPVMSVDRNDMVFKGAKFFLGGMNVYYLNKRDNTLLTQKEVFGEQYLIEEDLSEMEWNITNESKKIGYYTCYKAIGYRSFYNRENELKKSPKIAWFCPELPNLFGPFEAVGLPGLVLEFQVGQYGFVASKIIVSEENIDLKKPTDGKHTTQKELSDYFMKLAQDRN